MKTILFNPYDYDIINKFVSLLSTDEISDTCNYFFTSTIGIIHTIDLIRIKQAYCFLNYDDENITGAILIIKEMDKWIGHLFCLRKNNHIDFCKEVFKIIKEDLKIKELTAYIPKENLKAKMISSMFGFKKICETDIIMQNKNGTSKCDLYICSLTED